MEQPPHQFIERQVGVEQLAVLDRTGKHRDMPPFGMVELGMDPLAPLLAFGKVLEQDSARSPAIFALRRREPHDRRDLFGLGEIALRREGQAVTL